jgi:glycosyltransferase involved in cell wall biosynthesis
MHTLKGVLLARRIRPDIIHFHAIGPSLFVPLARLLGMKVVVTHHGPDYKRAKWGRLAKTVLKLGERFGCKHANRIITISSGTQQHIKKKFGKNADLIPNGITPPEPAKDLIYINSLGLTSGKYVLAVARFVPEKGLHNLISAFSRIRTDWKLVIAGDADHETPYSRDIKSKAANNSNVVLTGVIQENALNEIYSHAGLFVLPSYYEGLPIALLEALSYGLSVLVSDIDPNLEIGLSDNRYFPVGNEDVLAQKLNHWINKGVLSVNEKRNQIEMVINQRYNWDKIAEQVYRVYEDTLAANR